MSRENTKKILLECLNEKPDCVMIVCKAGDQVRISYELGSPIETTFMLKLLNLKIDEILGYQLKTEQASKMGEIK